ncbi:hypothetical protein [Aestuariispira insulae]|uniref:Uncharacterized protein n=1 Tax=Aestuariispira insulae TaxID=1461337 RepID=A0A3D9H4E9_9PROT|nr:hypothetical protein [Aestuariispira insulae]RED43806.1 hypothetical protein DFP90_11829 [Aestuariispira insulae]
MIVHSLKLVRNLLPGLILVFLLMPAALAGSIPVGKRAELQLVLLGHIEANSNSAGNRYRHFSGTETAPDYYQFSKLHPVILQREGAYVLCADFISETGASVEMDFILVADRRGYQVTQVILNSRKTIMGYFRTFSE